MVQRLAGDVIEWCRSIATCSEDPAATTRTFLSPPMRVVHDRLSEWMSRLGMTVTVDAAGNLRGRYPAASQTSEEAVLLFGSHLDTVPDAGAFDGILGVVLGIALVELLAGQKLPYAIEVVGFSEEEGVRFGFPFIGSRALAGSLEAALLERRDSSGTSVREALEHFGLAPGELGRALAPETAIGFIEFHIEQGPVLDALDLPLGLVTDISGQSRAQVMFTGMAAHAGTTPMTARQDALAAAAAWISAVERDALAHPGLVATVGQVAASPGAANVVAGVCQVSLDVRHRDDAVRTDAIGRMIGAAESIGASRGVRVAGVRVHDQPSVAMDGRLVSLLDESIRTCGLPVKRMACGAGHDAMIMAARMPVAMLLLRTPGGISHHRSESVRTDDVAAALRVGHECLQSLSRATRTRP